MKLNIHTLIEQVVKEEMSKLGEAKPLKVNPKYNVFALDKATNKIVNGWDLDPKDKENIQDYLKKTSEYLKMDLKDNDLKPSDVIMASVKSLKAKNIDPFNWDSWKKNVEEAVTTLVTPDGKTMSQSQKDQVKNAKPGTTIVTKKVGEITEDFYKDATSAKDKVISVTLMNGNKLQAKVQRVDLDKALFDIGTGSISVNIKDGKASFVVKTPQSTSPVKTVDDEASKKYLSALALLSHANDTNKTSDTVDEAQQELYEVAIDEKKDKAEDVPPVEDAPIEATPAPAEGGVSAELNKHIASAIDAAAKCIQDSGDKKYEKVLGKVIKNLTAAQDALTDVQAHETKLAEIAAKEDEKSTATYSKDLSQILKKEFKNPSHVEAILKKYAKVIKQAKKDKKPQDLAEMISRHALKEGFVKK
jgi:hypothetical protein